MSGRRSEDADDEQRRELEFYLDTATEENMALGMDPRAARDAARRKLGNITRVQEEIYHMGTTNFVDSMLGDLRYATRSLRKSPGFTVTAILTLALGVGANIAIFSLTNAVMLRDLPFREPERIVSVYEDFSQRGGPASVEASPVAFLAWRDQNQGASGVFEDIAAMDGFDSYNLTGQGDPERLKGVGVTGNLFPLLGMKPLLGRTLLSEDEKPDAPKVAVVSEGLWKRRFAGDRGLVGRSVRLNGVVHQVVGVVPGTFQFPTPGAEVWVPLVFPSTELEQRFSFYLTVVGRLRPGIRLEQADAAVTGITNSLLAKFPGGAKIGATITPLRDVLTSKIRPTLLLLLATVSVVLLIACANVAQLLMARGAGRRQEIALRSALGAQRGRILRQLLTESFVLASLAATVGVAAAASTFWFLVRLVPDTFPAGTTLGIDLRVVAFAIVLAGLTTMAFGVGPAIAAARSDTNTVLRRETSRGAKGALRGFLTASEVALTVLLLMGAGLLLRSFANLRAVKPGFETSKLLMIETVLPESKYAAFPARMRFLGEILDRTAALPGVVSTGLTNFAPLTFKGGRANFVIEGRPDPQPGEGDPQTAVDRVVSAGFFAAMGIPVLSGRAMDRRDTGDHPSVAVISQAMARTYWRDRDPVGQRIRLGPPTNPWLTIVGVVADSRHINLDQAPEPTLYLAMTQGATASPFFWPRHLVIRTMGDPLPLAAQVRQVVSSIDPEQPVSKMQTVGQVIDSEMSGRGTQLILVAIFAALALVLASVGLYGVLSYTVAQSTPEIGIRIALGAPRRDVIAMVLWRTLLWASGGLIAGLLAAVALGRLIQPFLYEMPAADPWTFAGVGGLVLSIATLASWLPAARAASVDPMIALRNE
jgi:putative ABC transport system permease protein